MVEAEVSRGVEQEWIGYYGGIEQGEGMNRKGREPARSMIPFGSLTGKRMRKTRSR
jgi:hypothetical protein